MMIDCKSENVKPTEGNFITFLVNPQCNFSLLEPKTVKESTPFEV